MKEITEKIEVLCKTEEEAKELLKELNKRGYVWSDGSSLLSYTSHTEWANGDSYGLAYQIWEDKDITYSCLGGYLRKDCPTLSFKEFKEEYMENKCEFKRGDKILVRDFPDNDYIEKIFLTYIDGAFSPYICVAGVYEEGYENGEEFVTQHWKYAKKKEDTFELTVKINGKDVDPSTISKETWENLRNGTV